MLPAGSALIVKEHFSQSVNHDRCLVQMRSPNALTLLTEDKSWNERVVFREIWAVFPLTTEGHIDVICNLPMKTLHR